MDLDGTRTAVREFGAPASLAGIFAIGVPASELLVASLLLYGPGRTAGGAGAIVLLLVFSAAIGLRLARGSAPKCNCFGQLHSSPVSWKTLARNGALVMLASVALSAGLEGQTPSAFSLFRDLQGNTVLVSSLIVALVVLVVAGVMVIVSLLRSYGTVLLRVDDLERRLSAAGVPGLDTENSSSGLGLLPGSPAPAFAAIDADGAGISLSDLVAPGLPVMLLFTSPGCGPCEDLLPEVAAWQRAHSLSVTVAIANGGKTEEVVTQAREHGLTRMIGDTDLAIYKSFKAAGTPGAVLIAPNGTIASFLAVGAESVRQLLAGAVPTTGDSNVPAFRVGSLLPPLVLPGLDGKPVDVASTANPTLLLFWNPDCGFCRSMRDDVLAWERQRPRGAPRLIIVSSGEAAAVRAEGFSSIVALDADSTAGAPFGADGTPMAILIDGDGRVASQPAAGAEAVFALAGGRASMRLASNELAEATS